MRRTDVEATDWVIGQCGHERRRITNGIVGNEYLRAAVEQACKQLLDRNRKDEGRLLADDLPGRKR